MIGDVSGDSQVICLGEVKQVLLLHVPHLDHTHSHVLLYMNRDMEVKGQLYRFRDFKTLSIVPILPRFTPSPPHQKSLITSPHSHKSCSYIQPTWTRDCSLATTWNRMKTRLTPA